ncbi:MAG: metalloregulator ArsR/SmtB family transcription factor [Planctomycetota bacterium]|jgi:DNA-binding transcriptional ArsR family regulator|nr:metalloregulator ArsR/SmtB family transcription factor [Planctomycetota bacterium]
MAKGKKLPHDHGRGIDLALRRMPDGEKFEEAAAAFRQLCDSSRLRIFWLICHAEGCVSNIAAAVEMSDAAVSHHLRILKMHGLVKNRRLGKEVHYSLAESEKAKLAHRMIDDYFQMTCPYCNI